MSDDFYIQKVFNVWEEKNKIHLESQAPQISDAIDQLGSFFAPGEHYYYIVNFTNLTMEYVHPSINHVLGIEPEEFDLSKLLSIHHPDDLKTFHEKENTVAEFLLKFISPEDIPDYKVVYVNRIQRSDGKYIKLLHQAKAIRLSNDYKIQHVLGVHTDISHLNIPIDNKVSFIGMNGKPSYYSVDPKNPIFEVKNQTGFKFTDQELRIIQHIAEGLSTSEIAEELFIAESTVKTHRKNIFEKSGAKNSAHLIALAIRDGVI